MTPCPDCGAPTHLDGCDREALKIAARLELCWAVQALSDARRDARLTLDMLTAALD